MRLQVVHVAVAVALLGVAASVPLQNPWNSLKFGDSNEDKSTEDYGHGVRPQYGSSSATSPRYSQHQSIEDDSEEYGGHGYSSYGSIQRYSPYPAAAHGRGSNTQEYGRYGSMRYNMPSQRQQRPGHRYYYDYSDEVYDTAYQHLYKSLQADKGLYPSRRRSANAITIY